MKSYFIVFLLLFVFFSQNNLLVFCSSGEFDEVTVAEWVIDGDTFDTSDGDRIRLAARAHEKAKNLVRAETKPEALQETKNNIKSNIVNFAWHLMKLGRKETTIRTYTNYVNKLAKVANLNDPETVKLAIATHFQDTNTKRSATFAYDAFTKFLGITWEKPHYNIEHKKVFIPTFEELKIAINSGRKCTIAFSKLLYETGARKNEAERLQWTDIDCERKKLTIKASKNGNSRIVSVTRKLIEILDQLPKTSNLVFEKRGITTRQANFNERMKRLAKTHKNPRLKKIHFHTFRHCKALREYHKTKSVLHVKRILGHKSIMTTQRYVELYEEIYSDQPLNYTCEIALKVFEAKRLAEQGFQYVTGEYNDGGKLFRKVFQNSEVIS